MHLPYWFLSRPCIWQRTMVEIGTSLWKMLKKFTGVILMLVNAVTQEEQSMQLKGVRKIPFYTRVSECPFVHVFWIQLSFWKINMSAGICYFYIIFWERGLLPGIWHKMSSQCRAYTRESDCISGGRKFDSGPVPYFRGDCSRNNFYGHSPPFRWIVQERFCQLQAKVCARITG